MIKKLFLCFIIMAGGITLPSCSRSSHTVKVVKPKKRWLPYDQKTDRKKKRTKTVRMKS